MRHHRRRSLRTEEGGSEARAGSAGLRPVRPLGGGATGALAGWCDRPAPERHTYSSFGLASSDVESHRVAGILLSDEPAQIVRRGHLLAVRRGDDVAAEHVALAAEDHLAVAVPEAARRRQGCPG